MMLKTLRKAILAVVTAALASSVVLAQGPQTVRGTVTDPSGVPVVGASVFVQNTQNGAVTDANGNYSLSRVNSGDVLVFSCIGYTTREIAWNGGILNVTLEEDTEMLEETVVVGYGVQKKVNLTGAVAAVDGEEFAQRPVVDAAQALQGLVPGLTVSNSQAGTPGSQTTITLRGQGNLSGTGTPYILVDGVEMSLSDVNPNDIESISVLKDASSAAIYGARAAYGVILVTTKRGMEGRAQVSYSGNVGWNAPTVLPHMVSGVDFAKFWNAGATNAGAARKYSDVKIADLQKFIDDPDSVDPWAELGNNPLANPASFENSEKGLGNTDYFKLHYKDWAFKQNHNISVRGGGKKAQYYISGGMYDEDGILRFANMGYKRFNVNANTQAQVTDWLKVTFNTKYIHGQQDTPFGGDGLSYGFFHTLAREFATKHYMDPNGHYVEYTMIPYLQSGTYTTTKRDNINITAAVQAQPVKNWFINFEYTTKLGFQNYEALVIAPDIYLMDGTTTVKGVRDELNVPRDGRYARANTDTRYNSINLYTNYLFTLGEKNNFTLLAGYQEEDYHYAYIKNSITGLYSTSNPNVTMGTGDKVTVDNRYGWATRGYFGRINYDYDGRYLLELNGRYDASSRFAADHRWGFFPSVSAGWNIHKEAFLRNADWLSNLKLRASYGILGNQAGADTYTFAATMAMSSGLGGYIFSDGRHNYTQAPGVVNPSTTWEKVYSQNVGLDFGFFQNALTGSFDLFQRETRDMLGPGEDFPDFFGADAPETNNADMRNRGWEFAINYRGQVGRDFIYSIGGSVSDATAQVTRYSNPTGTNPAGNWYEGKMVGEIWGYKVAGLIPDQAAADAYNNTYDLSYISAVPWTPGDVQYIDLNGDNKINKGNNVLGDMGDLTVIGNTTPRYNYSIDGMVGWKGLALSWLFQGVGKRDWNPGSAPYFWGWGAFAQVTVFDQHMDYWTEENTDAYYPKPYIHNAGGIGKFRNKNMQTGDRYLQNAAYLRLKNVTLAYTLPATLIKKIGLQKAQVYVSGENLLTFTKLAGMFDPEGIYTYNSYTSEGGKNYPMNKTISVGVVVNL